MDAFLQTVPASSFANNFTRTCPDARCKCNVAKRTARSLAPRHGDLLQRRLVA